MLSGDSRLTTQFARYTAPILEWPVQLLQILSLSPDID